MKKRNIIVIGASAGGFEVIKQLVAALPSDFDAAIFIVWHISPNVRGILPQVLCKLTALPVSHAVDGEPIVYGRIYIAPPDYHMLLEKGRVRVTKGPKENRFRPAVDPLFRSAAYTYGQQVIGIILSGALDDGSAGLWTIKYKGGLAIVQSPAEAEVPAMPQNALLAVKADYTLSVADMAPILVDLINEQIQAAEVQDTVNDDRMRQEIQIALNDNYPDTSKNLGDPTRYTCPECHGVLSALAEGGRIRFRCHTGHAFSPDSLLTAITDSVEDNMWSAIRSMQESIIMLNHMGDHFAEANQPKVAAVYFQKAREAESRAQALRLLVTQHERLTIESIRQQAQNEGNTSSPDT